MSEKAFNLLHEPWIMVMRPDGATEEVSMLDAFRQASQYQCLAGELPTQDIAILRLLLAVLHTVFSRYDIDGNESEFESPYNALDRWKTLWDRGNLPTDIIEKYLLEYEDRFYLFHPKQPFFQVAKLEKSTDYFAAKLNGALSESSNKVRLFPQFSGDDKYNLKFSEAARWLIHVNAFDDTSSKPKSKGLPSPGVGWLGKLGLITARGKTIYETLLLNLVFLQDGEDKLWGVNKPIWEVDYIRNGERIEINVPDNLAELYTVQSRRLLLKSDRFTVTGFSLLGGDFFQKENAFVEQMTIWQYGKSSGDNTEKYRPRRHSDSRQIWRGFSSIASQSDGKKRPGIVSWLARLRTNQLISRKQYSFCIASVQYGDKDFFVDNVFSDTLSINSDLLTDMNDSWINHIINELETTELLVKAIGNLACDLAKSAGDSDGSSQRNAAKEQAYFRLDLPFRQWLQKIDPQTDEMSETSDNWFIQSKELIRAFGSELLKLTGAKEFAGRVVSEKIRSKEVLIRYSSPEAFNKFLKRTASRVTLKGGKNHE